MHFANYFQALWAQDMSMRAYDLGLQLAGKYYEDLSSSFRRWSCEWKREANFHVKPVNFFSLAMQFSLICYAILSYLLCYLLLLAMLFSLTYHAFYLHLLCMI
jgi:hypothetical protein